jgi:hypothetical protein
MAQLQPPRVKTKSHELQQAVLAAEAKHHGRRAEGVEETWEAASKAPRHPQVRTLYTAFDDGQDLTIPETGTEHLPR